MEGWTSLFGNMVAPDVSWLAISMSSDSVPRAASLLLCVLAVMIEPAIVARASRAQETFRTGVVLLTIDVQITPAKDAPLRELAAEDFEVVVFGRRRPVTSAARLHLDEASVVASPPRPGPDSDAGCIFGFHRKTDRPTAHYRLGIQPADTDRSARAVTVKTTDSAFATQWLVWRLPIR